MLQLFITDGAHWCRASCSTVLRPDSKLCVSVRVLVNSTEVPWPLSYEYFTNHLNYTLLDVRHAGLAQCAVLADDVSAQQGLDVRLVLHLVAPARVLDCRAVSRLINYQFVSLMLRLAAGHGLKLCPAQRGRLRANRLYATSVARSLGPGAGGSRSWADLLGRYLEGATAGPARAPVRRVLAAGLALSVKLVPPEARSAPPSTP